MRKIIRNDGGKNRNMIAITNSVSSWSLILARFLAVPLEEQLCFMFILLLEKKNTSGILLVFLTIVMITPQVREPLWRFYSSLRLRIPTILSRTGVLSTG